MMNKPQLLVLSLGGPITMKPSDSGGITSKLGAAVLVASVPALADVGDIDTRSSFRLPGPSLTPANLVEVARSMKSQSGFGRHAAKGYNDDTEFINRGEIRRNTPTKIAVGQRRLIARAL